MHNSQLAEETLYQDWVRFTAEVCCDSLEANLVIFSVAVRYSQRQRQSRDSLRLSHQPGTRISCIFLNLGLFVIFRFVQSDSVILVSDRDRVSVIDYWQLTVGRRGGVVSESDDRPEGREFESRPIRHMRLCSWAKHFTTNCPCLLG